MRALVVGAGNIGTTLANLLLAHRRPLSIDEVVVRKVGPVPAWRVSDLELLAQRGAIIEAPADAPGVRALLATADYIFDCRREGAALADRGLYAELPRLLGASAQGSEAGFGLPFVAGVNQEAVAGARFVQIASCNTHATATLLRALGGPGLEAIDEADFVCVRRSEDVGGHERLVVATVVVRHRDPHAGTHHAADARRVFATVGLAPAVTSSDATTPSQLMHAVRFAVRLRTGADVASARDRVAVDPLLATTAKFDSNALFELGRRYGFQGRIFAHAVVVAGDLLVDRCSIKGWAFVPQEGNTLVSTLEAFLLQTRHPRLAAVTHELRAALIERRW